MSYDPDLYFPVMYGLLIANRDGRLRGEMLEASDARLRRAARSANFTASQADQSVPESRHNP